MKKAAWILLDLAAFTAASLLLFRLSPSAGWWIVNMFALGLVWTIVRAIFMDLR